MCGLMCSVTSISGYKDPYSSQCGTGGCPDLGNKLSPLYFPSFNFVIAPSSLPQESELFSKVSALNFQDTGTEFLIYFDLN